MTSYGKAKAKKPKMRKISGNDKGRSKPPNMSVSWGRGASEYRPGLFTKQYFVERGEGCAADVFYALRENLEAINRERIEIGEKPIRGCTYNSFAKYWHWFKLLGLIEPANRTEPSIYDFLEEKVFYRLTDKGRGEVRAWEDPIRAAHPEFV
jgi:hypothetical protein